MAHVRTRELSVTSASNYLHFNASDFRFHLLVQSKKAFQHHFDHCVRNVWNLHRNSDSVIYLFCSYLQHKMFKSERKIYINVSTRPVPSLDNSIEVTNETCVEIVHPWTYGWQTKSLLQRPQQDTYLEIQISYVSRQPDYTHEQSFGCSSDRQVFICLLPSRESPDGRDEIWNCTFWNYRDAGYKDRRLVEKHLQGSIQGAVQQMFGTTLICSDISGRFSQEVKTLLDYNRCQT